MKRTQVRISEELNTGKFNEMVRLVDSFAAQKDDFLVAYSHLKYLSQLKGHHIQEAILKVSFVSPYNLKARAWRLALAEALLTIDRYWQATIKKIRKHIYRRFDIEQERHYAFWLLFGYRCLPLVVNGVVPEGMPKTKTGEPEIVLDDKQKRHIVIFLRRVLLEHLGARPRVHLKRSMVFDAEMYRAFEENGRQYIAVSKLDERGRMAIPLKGHQTIEGNIRLVLDRGSRTVEIHVVGYLTQEPSPEENIVGGDFGQTELLATDAGNKYGTSFGTDLKAFADMVDVRGRNRNKVHAFEKSLRTTDPQQARRIRKNNLGRKKWDRCKARALGRIKTDVNTAINRFIDSEHPSVLIHEDLTHYRPPFGKGRFSRICSFWFRSILSDRIPFKLQARGSGSQAVNPAYSSQTCPSCGYVDPKNRNGDRFQCRNPECPDNGAVLDADVVGARNLKARKDDPEIRLWTSKTRVREILVKRFEERRLEGKAAKVVDPTVPAKTPDTAMTSVHVERSLGERNYNDVVGG
jgi:transposase